MNEFFCNFFICITLQWTDEGRILRVETPGASFIKPKLWEDRFYSGLIKEAMERTATRSFSDVTIITHSENLPIGSSVSGVGEAEFVLMFI